MASIFNCQRVALEQVLQGSSLLEEVEIDRKAYYIFGAAADCDFQLPTLEARHHSALVHHTDSRLFLIDLQSVNCCYAPSC